MKYYELEDDLEIKGRWFLDGLVDGNHRELDERDFTYGRPVHLGPPLRVSSYDTDEIVLVKPPLTVGLNSKGKPLDFTYTNSDMPVVSKQVGEILASIAAPEIQRIPTNVVSQKETYEILNVSSCIDCIDDELSEIERYTEEDERPELIGEPQMVIKLLIDPRRAGGKHIFRLKGWDVVIIISELVKTIFQKEKIRGVKFAPV